VPALAAVFKWKQDPALLSLVKEDTGNTMVHSTDEKMEYYHEIWTLHSVNCASWCTYV